MQGFALEKASATVLNVWPSARVADSKQGDGFDHGGIVAQQDDEVRWEFKRLG